MPGSAISNTSSNSFSLRKVPRILSRSAPSRFASRFIEGYAEANRQKPSEIAAKRTILNVHLIPSLGTLKLDAVTNERIQLLKHRLKEKAPKTVNNILTVLSVLLKKAVEWDVIERMPCTIRLLKVPKQSMGFYDFDEYDRLVEAAQKLGPATYVVALLGGDAGLRCGEIIALEWSDVDLRKRQLCIQRSEWRGHVTVPKGGRLRYVPMTIRLAAALRDYRPLKAARVSCQRDGSPLIQEMVGDHVRRAAKRAGVAVWSASPSTYLLFALGDARRTCESNSRARRAPGSFNDAAVHAPESGGARRSDSSPR